MNFFSYLLSVVAAAALFYVAIPGAGAFLVRHRWRRFRVAVLESTTFPELRYGVPQEPSRYRFFGRLEAVQGEDRIWLENEGVSVGVDLLNVPIFLIPGIARRSRSYPDETPRILYWREITALAEGTRFYVAGRVVEESGDYFFLGHEDHHPLVIIYDGPEHSFFKRTIWTGRQRNEYWNHLTVPALTGGFLAQLLIAVISIGESRLATLIAVVAALVPVLPLVPPGVVGYYFYRRIWRAARRRRAVRDVVRLGTGRSEARDLIARSVGKHVWLQELFAVFLLLLGIAANGYGIAVILALTLFAP